MNTTFTKARKFEKATTVGGLVVAAICASALAVLGAGVSAAPAGADPVGCAAVGLGPFGGSSFCAFGTGYHRVVVRCAAPIGQQVSDIGGPWVPALAVSSQKCPDNLGLGAPAPVSVYYQTRPVGPAVVPNVVGETLARATSDLGTVGLASATAPYNGCPPNTGFFAASQNVDAGSRVDVGTVVTLTVACR